MSNAMKVLLGVLGVLVLGLVSVASVVIGANNDAVRQEAGIEAQYKQNQNNYDNMFKRILEASQVPQHMASDLKSLYETAVIGRKGSDQELVRFVTEANPTVDSSVYVKVQQLIESGRNSFEADQKTLLDKVRVYKIALNSIPNGLVVRALGYPKLDLAKYDIVTSDETAKAFETKKAQPLNLRPGAEPSK